MRPVLTTVTALMILSGCNQIHVEYINETLPLFSLTDVNTTSIFFETSVASDQFTASPEMVSAWYFGHST